MPSSPVPLVDLKTQYSALKSEIDSAVEAVMTRGDFILGTEVNSFEQSFAEFCGTDFAVGCASGTDALYLALRALDVGPGDEVILPAMTFAASAIGVIMCGARPVLVDVDPETALIDLAAVERAITENTKVLMPVHLYGQCMNMNALNELAARYDLAVVEDAAQAHGASDDAGNVAGGSGSLAVSASTPARISGPMAMGESSRPAMQVWRIAFELFAIGDPASNTTTKQLA